MAGHRRHRCRRSPRRAAPLGRSIRCRPPARRPLANALYSQGKHAEAEQAYRAVLAAQERVLGAEHSDVALSCYNLALCLKAHQKLPEALQLMQRAEQIWQKKLGPDHPHTKLATLNRQLIEAALK